MHKNIHVKGTWSPFFSLKQIHWGFERVSEEFNSITCLYLFPSVFPVHLELHLLTSLNILVFSSLINIQQTYHLLCGSKGFLPLLIARWVDFQLETLQDWCLHLKVPSSERSSLNRYTVIHFYFLYIFCHYLKLYYWVILLIFLCLYYASQ